MLIYIGSYKTFTWNKQERRTAVKEIENANIAKLTMKLSVKYCFKLSYQGGGQKLFNKHTWLWK